jgi:hypothetical protein
MPVGSGVFGLVLPLQPLFVNAEPWCNLQPGQCVGKSSGTGIAG